MGTEAYVRVARYAGLKQTSALVESLRALGGDPRNVFETLRRHGLVGVVLASVPETDLRAVLPAALIEEFEAWRAKPRPSNDVLLQGFVKARDTLEAQGVPVLLLKGCYFAERLYGDLAHRPQWDVDILVRERDFRRAVRILIGSGFVPYSYDLHSRTLACGGWKLDVHRCLRRAPAIRFDELALWESAIDARAGGVAFRTLSDEGNLVLLVVGAFEDLGQATAKLRQLLDLYLLLRDIDVHFAWNEFFARREAENMAGVSVNIFSLVIELFGAQAELPRLEAALMARRNCLDAATRAEAARLVFADRKQPENFAWFARIYPESVPRYLAWFWYGGFPSNLRAFNPRRLTANLRAAFSRARR